MIDPSKYAAIFKMRLACRAEHVDRLIRYPDLPLLDPLVQMQLLSGQDIEQPHGQRIDWSTPEIAERHARCKEVFLHRISKEYHDVREGSRANLNFFKESHGDHDEVVVRCKLALAAALLCSGEDESKAVDDDAEAEVLLKSVLKMTGDTKARDDGERLYLASLELSALFFLSQLYVIQEKGDSEADEIKLRARTQATKWLGPKHWLTGFLSR